MINEEEETFRILAEQQYDKYVAREAVPFTPGTIASRLGPRGECWTNAWQRARKSSKLRYAEGFVGKGDGKIIRHAFCVGEDNRVVEVTEGYDTAEVYAGVILDLDTVTYIRDVILGGDEFHSSVLQVVLPSGNAGAQILKALRGEHLSKENRGLLDP